MLLDIRFVTTTYVVVMRSKTIFLVALGAVVFGLVLYSDFRHKPVVTPGEIIKPTVHPANAPRIAAFTRHSNSPMPDAQIQTNRNPVVRYLNGEEIPKLSPAQVEPFLSSNRRSAGSLLAAFRTTGEVGYLREAMEKYPNDPRVNYAAAMRADLTPEERHQALENLKSDPNNALGNYLSAFADFKSGDQAAALQEMAAAGKKPGWQDYTADFIQNSEEAYRAAGYSEAEAKAMGASGVPLPDLSEFKSVGKNLVELAKTYQQSGDAASAQAALQSAMNIGQQVNSATQQPPITTLVGIAIERMALETMDPGAPYGDSGQTVQDQINALVQQREAIRNLSKQESGLLGSMSDTDLVTYYDRLKTFGWLSAAQWAVEKYGNQ